MGWRKSMSVYEFASDVSALRTITIIVLFQRRECRARPAPGVSSTRDWSCAASICDTKTEIFGAASGRPRLWPGSATGAVKLQQWRDKTGEERQTRAAQLYTPAEVHRFSIATNVRFSFARRKTRKKTRSQKESQKQWARPDSLLGLRWNCHHTLCRIRHRLQLSLHQPTPTRPGTTTPTPTLSSRSSFPNNWAHQLHSHTLLACTHSCKILAPRAPTKTSTNNTVVFHSQCPPKR